MVQQRATGESSFLYRGPPGCYGAVLRALSWVVNPESGRSLLEEGRVRTVRLARSSGQVHLDLPDSPVARVIAEDLQCELTDHLGGDRAISVVLVERSLYTLAAPPPWRKEH